MPLPQLPLSCFAKHPEEVRKYFFSPPLENSSSRLLIDLLLQRQLVQTFHLAFISKNRSHKHQAESSYITQTYIYLCVYVYTRCHVSSRTEDQLVLCRDSNSSLHYLCLPFSGTFRIIRMLTDTKSFRLCCLRKFAKLRKKSCFIEKNIVLNALSFQILLQRHQLKYYKIMNIL